MVKMYKILFFNTLALGTLTAISSYNWYTAWIGLEINLLSLIPLLKDPLNKFPSEAALKYFISQTIGSSLILYTIVMFSFSKTPLASQMEMPETIAISSALLLKMGAAPFHFWMPEVISGLNWKNIYIIMTWQKIAPLTLLFYLIDSFIMLFSIIIVASSMISGIQGLNQTCMRKIMAYSSINHTSWMIASMLNSFSIFIYYFLIYCLINFNMVLVFNKFSILYLSQLIKTFSSQKIMKFLFMLNFLSLGGLPPFIGFLPKWMTINMMVNNNHYFVAAMLIIFTLISLYFYLRVTFSSFTVQAQETLVLLFKKINFFHFMTNMLSFMGLIMCGFMDSFF
uniref:NADH-ubiquinone oxidoreductase chain 2 n=1 Tax=Curculionidae sp. MT-2014 TaxID=1560010 RepID=A0A0A0RVC9_9CUCU|nr:NADH dehydrogenase subunit 2 [Curculionidae sp. MT-2014]